MSTRQAPAATSTGPGSAMPGKDVTGEVTFLARELKAPLIAATFAELGDQARDQGWSHEEYLAAVLGRQVASRATNGTRMRISAARLPQIKTLEDFSFTHVASATRDVIGHLATTTFVGRRENVVHHRCGVGESFARGRLEPGEPVHRHDLDALTESRCLRAEPRLAHLFRAAFDHVQQPGWAGLVADRCQLDHYGHELVATAGVTPTMFIDTKDFDAVQALRVIDEQPSASGEDSVR